MSIWSNHVRFCICNLKVQIIWWLNIRNPLISFVLLWISGAGETSTLNEFMAFGNVYMHVMVVNCYHFCFQQGNTPLHLAALNNQAEVTRILIKKKCQVNIQNCVSFFFFCYELLVEKLWGTRLKFFKHSLRIWILLLELIPWSILIDIYGFAQYIKMYHSLKLSNKILFFKKCWIFIKRQNSCQFVNKLGFSFVLTVQYK